MQHISHFILKTQNPLHYASFHIGTPLKTGGIKPQIPKTSRVTERPTALVTSRDGVVHCAASMKPAGGMKMNHLSLVRRACVPVFACGILLLPAPFLQAKDAQEAVASDSVALDQLEFFPSPLDAEFATPAPRDAPQGLQLVAHQDPALLALEEERSAAGYERSLNQLESQRGALALELYEPMLSLAQLRQRGGDHAEALRLLQRAAFIDKANHGLYSSGQISLARQILISLRALDDRDAVHDQLERLIVLNRRHYGRAHVETALALLEFGTWQVEDFLWQLQRGGYAQLQPALAGTDPLDRYERQSNYLTPLYAAQKTFIDAINILVEQRDFTNPGLFDLENGLIETYYLNAKRDLIRQNPDYRYQVPKRGPGSLEPMQRMALQPPDYQQGITSYQRQLAYLQRSPTATVGQLSRIMLALADWHQLFGQYAEAAGQRERLRTLLGKAGLDNAQVETLMSSDSPVLLPTFVHGPLSPRDFAPQDTRGHVDLVLHVDRRGEVSDVETLGTSDGTPDAVVQQLVSLVAASRFRNDAENGSTHGIRYYYRY
jgi:hypothetical protein